MTTLSELSSLRAISNSICEFTDSDKYIDILLTRYPDRISKFTQFITGAYFTHASIGMGDSSGIFYSLVSNGFRFEEPYKHPTFKGKEVPCRLYHLKVSAETYGEIKKTLEYHIEHSKNYKYNYIGVLLCILHISLKRENRYFCSQFVSEVLEYAKATKLKKSSALYLPDDFMHEKELTLSFNGTLRNLITARTAYLAVYA